MMVNGAAVVLGTDQDYEKLLSSSLFEWRDFDLFSLENLKKNKKTKNKNRPRGGFEYRLRTARTHFHHVSSSEKSCRHRLCELQFGSDLLLRLVVK